MRRLLAAGAADPAADRPPSEPSSDAERAMVVIVDDDNRLAEVMCAVMEDGGMTARVFSCAEDVLEADVSGAACLLIDAHLPGMSGLDLLRRLREAGDRTPAIMITGSSDVAMAVEAMKIGASDFIEKPVGRDDLLTSVGRVRERAQDLARPPAWREAAAKQIAGLTARQHLIMELVLAGHPNKNIAADLGISQRTVENHRAAIMTKTGSKSLPALARLALAATWTGDATPIG